MRNLLGLIFLTISLLLQAKNDPTTSRSMLAKRTDSSIKIDGELNEASWAIVGAASQFVQLEPRPGENASFDSEVKLLYDDKAIYVGAHLKDNQPDSIYIQFSERDDVGVVDWFGLVLDTYQDGQNAVGFYVTAAGVQIDSKISEGGFGSNNPINVGDESWDAVWESHVKIVDDGWIVEMMIPYSALRFANAEVQSWNLNFCRMIRRYREQSFWSPIDPAGSGFMVQSGVLENLENIKSPVRLSATPFIAGYAEVYKDPASDPEKSTGQSFNGGMDIKYGINEAFTLDMTLIPDFGEARSDQQVLNLSPFEVRFNENRQFFTEGTELFNRNGLFYSRRVGGSTTNYEEVENHLNLNEEIKENPTTAKLLNATKISGRTESGLGIGFFNAVEGATHATIRDIETGNTRRWKTSPLTNYNVLVFNQNLKNNSSATIINTNVLRDGAAYDANVLGAELSLNNKKNTYSFGTSGAFSSKIYPGSNYNGHTWAASFGKTAGNFNWRLGYSEESDTYDPNDLGFLYNNNSREVFGNLSLARYEDFG
ncbi:MAG: carbohydrate binding family 9 domain-containing protein, partial [Saprospiraceae bacterium]|nr:carbohydrate binding family 9 domain-containing protein [Saprospiraceae bacterium]